MQTDAVPLMKHSPQIDASSVAATLNGSADYAFVLDGERKIRGFVCRDAMGSASPQLNQIECIRRTTPLDDVVELVVASRAPLPVVEADGSYCGSVNKTNVLNVLTRHRSSHV
jgi:glycine betaine/proline transport system ATP-binding protein